MWKRSLVTGVVVFLLFQSTNSRIALPSPDGSHEIESDTGRFDEPAAAAAFWLQKRAPAGASALPMDRYRVAVEHARRMPGYSTRFGARLAPVIDRGRAEAIVTNVHDSAALGTWTALGPGNIGGRTRAILIDPQNPNIMYAAAIGGGVWKTVDGGASWNPLSDLLMANIAVGTLAMDPNNTNTIYAGTGEGYVNLDALRGAGIFKTIDGGATWTQLANTGTSDFYYVNKIVVSRLNSQRAYAATRTGIWRSLDGGSTWTQSFNGSSYEAGCMDLAIRTDQTTDFIIASCGWQVDPGWSQGVLLRNTTAETSTTWSTVLTDPSLGRTSLAIAPSNQAIMYALAMCGSRTGCPTGYFQGLLGVYRSIDGGATWTQRVSNKSPTVLNTWLLTNPREAAGCLGPPTMRNQGWYDNVIQVDPVDPAIVWAGGVDLFRSNDSGANWGLASHWNDSPFYNYSHADHHALVFHPQYNGTTNQTLFDGNDGGVFRTTTALATLATGGAQGDCNGNLNSQVHWANVNNGYAVTQFYDGAVSPDGATYIAGAQDNGTDRGTDAGGANAWTAILSGDGGYVAIDPTNPTTLYAENFNLSIQKSVAGGAFQKATTGIENNDSGFLFIAPFFMDPTNSQRLWTGGNKVWRTDNGAASWSQVGANLAPGQVSAIGQATANPNRVLVGTSTGTIYRIDTATSANSSTPWVSNATPRAGYVSWIAFDPQQASVAYAVYSSFDGLSTDRHVYKSTDGGTQWAPIDGSGATGLPDIPVHTIAVDPTNTARIFIGTDIGVFTTLDGGGTWQKENTGFANVSTDALLINTAGGVTRLYAFTHGRGAWRVPLVGGGCSFTLSPSGQNFNSPGGTGSFSVLSSAGCSWQASPDATWVHIISGSSGNGNGTVNYSVDANTGSLSRSAHITAGGVQYTITEGPATCSYAVNPTSQSFPPGGGPATFTVAAPAACGWQASSAIGWITIVSTTPSPGVGNGSVSVSVAANSGAARSASIAIAGANITVSQGALSSSIANDEIAGAIVVSSLSTVINQNTQGATSNPADPVHSCTSGQDAASVWFRFVPNFSGTVQANTSGSNYDTVLSAYTGTGSAGPELACHDDIIPGIKQQSAISLVVSSGQSYLVEVSAYGSSGVGGALVLTFSANDQVSAPTVIGSLPFQTAQDTSQATSDLGDPIHSCTGSSDSSTVWFRYTATFTGSIMIDTQGSDYDTVVSVYPTSLSTELACNDDTDFTYQSGARAPVVSGQSYLIEVSSYGFDSAGNLSLNVYGNDQPASATLVSATPYQTIEFVGPASSGGSDPILSCMGDRADHSVWFRYVSPSSGPVRVNTAGSDFDTVLAVYTGSTAPGAEIACNDDNGSSLQSLASFNAVAGQSYLIVAGAFPYVDFPLGNDGTLNLLIQTDTACAFTLSPASQSFTATGGSGGFLLTANFPDCTWTASSGSAFVGLTSAASGTGTANITYSVAANPGVARNGTIAAGGQTFTVMQAGSLADLVVTAFTAPSTGVAGGTINVSATVLNQGNAGAGAFRLEFYYSPTQGLTPSSTDSLWGCDIPSLAAQSTFVCSGPIGVPAKLAPGTYYPIANADDASAVPESNKTNNTRVADSGAIVLRSSSAALSVSKTVRSR